MKHPKQQKQTTSSDAPKPPELARRRENHNSIIMSGRTIGEKRERLETKSERAAARKKDKLAKVSRIILTVAGFLVLIFVLIGLYFSFNGNKGIESSTNVGEDSAFESTNEPNIDIIDEDSASHGQITSRMKKYIYQAENDLRELGYNPTKAIIPSGSIREINIYLDGYNGFIKMTIDRDPAVSAEDTDRMIRYLSAQGINDYSYIDVRIDGKAYWK